MEITCEPKRNELSLTISARIFENNQTEILPEIEKLQAAAKEFLPSDERVYTYPPATIHFSLINFATFDLGATNFEKGREERKQQSWYPQFIQYVEKNILPRISVPTSLKIEQFFFKNPFPSALTLNISCDPQWITNLKKIYDEAKGPLERMGVPLKKAGTTEAGGKVFKVNILRFFTTEHLTTIDNVDWIKDFIDKHNEDFQKSEKRIVLTQPILVISNPYLSNRNPRVAPPPADA